MSVVINEFEVVAEAEPGSIQAPAAGAAPPPAAAKPRASAFEPIMRQLMERALRVRAD